MNDEFNSIYENGKHIVFENVDHLNDDGTWGMISKPVAEFYDLEAHNQFFAALELLGAAEKALEFIRSIDGYEKSITAILLENAIRQAKGDEIKV